MRTGSWTIFSGCGYGIPSLGQEGRVPLLLGVGGGPWIPGIVGRRKWFSLWRTHCVPDVTLTYKMSLSNSLWPGGLIATISG